MTLIIKNADKNFANIIKGMAKMSAKKISIKTQTEPSDRLKNAIKEVESGKVETFEDFQSYKTSMDS